MHKEDLPAKVGDFLQITNFLKLRGLLAMADIQKTFDSVNHPFLITRLKKFGFGQTFINQGNLLIWVCGV